MNLFNSSYTLDYEALEIPLEYEKEIDLAILEQPEVKYYKYANDLVYGEVLFTNATDETDLKKRCIMVGAVCIPQCYTTKVKEVRVYRRGNWWGPWEKVSSCFYNEYGDGGSITMSYEYLKTSTWETGASVLFAISWLNAHVFYSVARSHTYGTTYTCDMSPSSWALSVWAQ